MKIFIIGMNSVGKQAVLNDLEQLGIPHGKKFTSLETIEQEHYLQDYLYYDNNEVSRMFENKAYFFLRENNNYSIPFYEGISLYEYENNEVFSLSPDQFLDVPKFDSKSVFIWMDANVKNRHSRFIQERRKYNFNEVSVFENAYPAEFIEKFYSYNRVLYFNNEDPLRVSALIASLIKHNDLINIYENRFV